jgi:hypothetical protein
VTYLRKPKIQVALLRTICRWVFLFPVVGHGLAHAEQQKIKVATSSSPSPEIILTSPGDINFDREVRALVGEKSELAEKLSPYLLLLKNKTQHTIVAYTAIWMLKRTDRKDAPLYVKYVYPTAITGAVSKDDVPRDRELQPSEERLVGLDFDVGRRAILSNGSSSISQLASHQENQFLDVIGVEIGLDAVIFDTGELIGPDHAKLAEGFAQYVDAYQSLYLEILNSLKTGVTPENIFKAIDDRRARDAKIVRSDPRANREFALIAEQDILQWYQEHGDHDLEGHFSRCLRQPAFVVKRLP